MDKLVRERVKVKKENPLFGTVLLDCDLAVYLDISDSKLKERCIKRGAEFNDAKNMQKMILEEIKKSDIPSIKIKID